MKIIIKQEGESAIRLWFPTRMILSDTAARIMARKSAVKEKSKKDDDKSSLRDQILEEINPDEIKATIQREIREDIKEEFDGLTDEEKEKAEQAFSKGDFFSSIPPEAAVDAVRILRQMKKDHPGVPLVEVNSANGDRILITL